MRKALPASLECCRILYGPYGSCHGDDFGAFLPIIDGREWRVIMSVGLGWEHVSISGARPTPPPWAVMAALKDLFWDPEEAVMQLHPPASTYVNHHPFCLHLWRPMAGEIPLPPTFLVGPLASESGRTPTPRQGLGPVATALLEGRFPHD